MDPRPTTPRRGRVDEYLSKQFVACDQPFQIRVSKKALSKIVNRDILPPAATGGTSAGTPPALVPWRAQEQERGEPPLTCYRILDHNIFTSAEQWRETSKSDLGFRRPNPAVEKAFREEALLEESGARAAPAVQKKDPAEAALLDTGRGSTAWNGGQQQLAEDRICKRCWAWGRSGAPAGDVVDAGSRKAEQL